MGQNKRRPSKSSEIPSEIQYAMQDIVKEGDYWECWTMPNDLLDGLSLREYWRQTSTVNVVIVIQQMAMAPRA